MLKTYPMSIGRSVDEILRTVRKLQASDADAMRTPERFADGRIADRADPADHKRPTVDGLILEHEHIGGMMSAARTVIANAGRTAIAKPARNGALGDRQADGVPA